MTPSLEHLAAVAPYLDLRAITRRAEYTSTQIFILVGKRPHPRHLWIECGEIQLRERASDHSVECYLGKGATDEEHDSAFAFRIPIIGGRLAHLSYGRTVIEATIDPMDYDDGHVPPPGYAPFQGACRECESAHPWAPYLPPKSDPSDPADVMAAIRGFPILIDTGASPREE